MIENKSGWQPAGRAVLTRPLDVGIVKGVIAIPDHVLHQVVVNDNRVEVVAVGSECWVDERKPRAEPGDHAVITKFAGYVMKGEDGVTYRVVNDNDIFMVRRPAEVNHV